MNAREIAVGIVLAQFFIFSLDWFVEALFASLSDMPLVHQSCQLGVIITMALTAIMFPVLAYHVLRD